MRFSSQVRPISFLKANAAELINRLDEAEAPLVITQNGEAKAVLQGITAYEDTQDTLALLKILALGSQQIAEGKVVSARTAMQRLRRRSANR